MLLLLLSCLRASVVQVSRVHKGFGVAAGAVMWFWVFYRAKQDLPVMLGLRHPWEGHGHGDGHGAGGH